jgi:type IV pilus assembly protein PilA
MPFLAGKWSASVNGKKVMLKAIKTRMGKQEDEGFTLIELMVVLLIIAILLAIAIPTFLGARNTANARSTQENLRNGLTAEQTNWTNTQAFVDASSAAGYSTLQGIEPSLSWIGTSGSATAVSQGGNTVLPTATANTVELVGWAKDGNCYAIYQSNNPTASFTAYGSWKSGGTACGNDATVPASSAALANGSAGLQATAPTAAQWGTTF